MPQEGNAEEGIMFEFHSKLEKFCRYLAVPSDAAW